MSEYNRRCIKSLLLLGPVVRGSLRLSLHCTQQHSRGMQADTSDFYGRNKSSIPALTLFLMAAPGWNDSLNETSGAAIRRESIFGHLRSLEPSKLPDAWHEALWKCMVMLADAP